MADAKDTTEASLWCSQARELVGKRKGKSKEVKAARDQIKSAVEKLEGLLQQLNALHAGRFGEFNPRYLRLAGQVLEAARSNKDDMLKRTANALATLQGEVDEAIDQQKALAKAFEKFDKLHVEQEIALSRASGLRGARTQGSAVKKALDEAAAFKSIATDLRNNAETDNDTSLVNINAAIGELGKIKPKITQAEEASKNVDKEAADYLKLMKEWAALKPKVQAALDELNSLPGAGRIAINLQEAYNRAIGGISQGSDGLWTGHKEACEAVRNYEESLTVGRETSTNHLAKELPSNVLDALNRCTAELLRHGELAPPYASKAHRDEALALAQSGRSDGPGAVTKLNTLRGTVKDEADRLTTEKAAAETAETRFNTAAAAMLTLEVPQPLYGPLKLVGDNTIAGELAARQWALATSKLNSAAAPLETIKGDFETTGPSWKAKKTELEKIVKEAAALIAFPVVARQAQLLRDTASEALKSFAGGRLSVGIEAYNKAVVDGKPLTTAMSELSALALTKKVPAGEDDRAAIVKLLAESGAAIRLQAELVRAEMRSFLDGKSELDGKQRRVLQEGYFARTVKVENDWLEFRAAAGGEKKPIEAALKTAREALKKALSDLKDLNTSKLKTEASKLGQEEAQQHAKNLPGRVQQMIDALQAAGDNCSVELQQLKDGSREARDIAVELTRRWDALTLKRANDRKALMGKVTSEIDGPLKKAGLSEKYREELQQASTDIKLMINTDDPDLLLVAQEMQERMKAQIEKIAAQPKLYAQNKTRLETLAKEVGELLDHLPETQRRLQTALTEALVLAKHTDPLEMKGKVDEFAGQVAAAKDLLKARDLQVAEYRKIKSKVRADFDKMKKATSTRMTDKAEAFEAWYEARIAEAKGLKGTEGGIPKAVEVLNAIQKRLDAVNTAENPEATLRELDGEEKQNQRLVIDLAQQFERECSNFLSTTLEQAKAATKNAEDGDSDMAKSLEGVVSGAKKIVSPYLKNLDLIPRGNQKAPDMTKLKADFQTAREMLADARRTAERLIQDPSSTNIDGPRLSADGVREGLVKLSRKWTERVQAYGAAVRAVTDDIRKAAASEQDVDVKKNADKATQIIESNLLSLFRGEMFSTDFAVLMQVPPEDKAGKKTLAAKQLAAREAALRVMRQGLADTANPLLARLNDTAQNPFEAPTMRVATSGILTVLKEIELQVLAAA